MCEIWSRPVQKGLCDVREECFARIVSTRTVNVGRCRCCRSTLCSLANPPVSLKPHTKNLRESTCEEKTSLQTSSSSKPKGKFPLNLSTPAPKQVPRFQSLGVRWLLGLGLGTPSSEFGHIRLEDVKTESMAFSWQCRCPCKDRSSPKRSASGEAIQPAAKVADTHPQRIAAVAPVYVRYLQTEANPERTGQQEMDAYIEILRKCTLFHTRNERPTSKQVARQLAKKRKTSNSQDENKHPCTNACEYVCIYVSTCICLPYHNLLPCFPFLAWPSS